MSTKQVFGQRLMDEGYLNDSMDLALDPKAIYNVTKEGDEVKTIYRVGIPAKRVNKPIKRKAETTP